MIPVTQTICNTSNGNCFAACIASILEIPLEEMPNYHSSDWADLWRKWLRERGLSLMTFDLPNNIEALDQRERMLLMPGYCILAANTSRHDQLHAVVVLDGEIVHDPNPNSPGTLTQWVQVDILVVLNPRKALFKTPEEQHEERIKKANSDYWANKPLPANNGSRVVTYRDE
jgi:hypothetical protein